MGCQIDEASARRCLSERGEAREYVIALGRFRARLSGDRELREVFRRKSPLREGSDDIAAGVVEGPRRGVGVGGLVVAGDDDPGPLRQGSGLRAIGRG